MREVGAAAAEAEVYLRTDTHLTFRGNELLFASVMADLGVEQPPDFSQLPFRSYPIAAPGLAMFDADGCGGRLRVAGRAAGPSRLDLWYQPPQGADPTVAPTVGGSGTGTTTMELAPFGWRVSVQVDGRYDVTLS